VPGSDGNVVHDHGLVVINETERKGTQIDKKGNRANDCLHYSRLAKKVGDGEGACRFLAD
jgi:hypothetical protein